MTERANGVFGSLMSRIIIHTMVILICALTSMTAVSLGKTIYVDDDNPGGINGTADDPVPTIVLAVSLAEDGDTIYVADGQYEETVVIDWNTFKGTYLNITGASESGVVLFSNGSNALVIRGKNVNVTNMTIQNSEIGIYIRQSDCGKMINLTLSGNTIGMRAVSSSGLWLDGIDSLDCYQFLLFEGTHHSKISNVSSNYTQDGPAFSGISLIDSYQIVMENATIRSNMSFGLQVSGRFDNIIKTSTVVNGEPIYYYYDLHGIEDEPVVISGLNLTTPEVSTIGKITLVNCTNVKIVNNNLLNQPFGSAVLMVDSTGIDVGFNVVNQDTGELSGDAGIRILGSSEIYVHDLLVPFTYAGVVLQDSSDTELFNVTSYGCVQGLVISGGGGHLVMNSRFDSNHEAGIRLIDTSRNRIYECIMNDNGKYGYFIQGDFENEIAPNTTVNGDPVLFFYGLNGNESAPLVISNRKLRAERVSNVGKITLANSSFVVIRNCTLVGNTYGSGIYLIHSKNLTVFGNAMSDCRDGISLVDVHRSLLYSNTMDATRYGLFIKDGYNNEIRQSNRANGEKIYYFYGNDTVIISDLNLTKKRVSNVGKISLISIERAEIEACRLENGTFGIFLRNCDDVSVNSTTLKNNGVGLKSEGTITLRNSLINRNKVGAEISGARCTIQENVFSSNGDGIRINSGGNRVSLNIFRNNDYGVRVEGNGNNVSDNDAFDNELSGIFVLGKENLIMRNNCTRNRYGIRVSGAVDNEISSNLIHHNRRHGLFVTLSGRNAIHSNIIYGNGFGTFEGYGIKLEDSDDLILRDNRIYWNEDADIMVWLSHNITVTNNVLNGTEYGIKMQYSSDSNVSDNDIRPERWGIYLRNSWNLTVRSNDVRDANNTGIWMYFTNSTLLEDNDLSDNRKVGIKLQASHQNTLKGNLITDSSTAIELVVSSDNMIIDNTLTTSTAILIRAESNRNTVENHTFSAIASPLVIEDSEDNTVSGCRFIGTDYGVEVTEAVEITIRNNEFNNVQSAIWMSGTEKAMIVDNEVDGAERGLYIRDGYRNELHSNWLNHCDENYVFVGGYMNMIFDSDIRTADRWDINITSLGVAAVINVSFDEDRLYIDNSSEIRVMNYLKVRLLFFDRTPIVGGDVRVLENDIVKYRSWGYGGIDDYTDEKGEIPWILVTYCFYNRSETPTYTEVNVSASYLYWEESRMVNMSTSHVEVFISDVSPPRLEWIGDLPYQHRGVNPMRGNSSQVFDFRVKYIDLNGDPPRTGYPRVIIDVNGDGDLDDTFPYADGTFREGAFTMEPLDPDDDDYTDGCVYVFSTRLPVSDDIQYRFTARDSKGLLATEVADGPISYHPGPMVIEARIEIAAVDLINDTVHVIVVAQSLNGSYYLALEEENFRVNDSGEWPLSVEWPLKRRVVLLLDWSSDVTDREINASKAAAYELIDRLTSEDEMEIIKFENGYHVLINFTSNKSALRDAVNRSVSRGSEAHIYDAIACALDDISRRDGRGHVITITFHSNYVSKPKGHVNLTALLDMITLSRSSVHFLSAPDVDTSELERIAEISGGLLLTSTHDEMAEMTDLIWNRTDAEHDITYIPDNLIHDGSIRIVVLNFTKDVVRAWAICNYTSPRTPPPELSISYPDGWWTSEELPVNVNLMGEGVSRLRIEWRSSPMYEGDLGKWTNWTGMDLNPRSQTVTFNVTSKAYQFRVSAWSISNDTTGWMYSSHDDILNTTMVDLTPPDFQGVSAPTPVWNSTFIHFNILSAEDQESGVSRLHYQLRWEGFPAVNWTSLQWNGTSFIMNLSGAFADGQYRLYAYVENGAGLMCEPVISDVLLDASTPKTHIDVPTTWVTQSRLVLNVTANGTNLGMIQIQWTETPLAVDEVTWADLRFLEGGGEFVVNVTNGMKYRFRARGWNALTGRVGGWYETGWLIADLTPPVIGSVNLSGNRTVQILRIADVEDRESGISSLSYVIQRDEVEIIRDTQNWSGGDITLVMKGQFGAGEYRANVTIASVSGLQSSMETEPLIIENGPPTVPLDLYPRDVIVSDLRPTFYWNGSTDADGDPVTYLIRVYVEGDLLISTVTSSTVFIPSTNLSIGKCVWEVAATDGERQSEWATADFVIGFPDLRVTLSLQLLGKRVNALDAGQNVALVATVLNLGPVDAEYVEIALYLDGHFMNNTLIGRVIAGGASPLSFNLLVPESGGEHQISAFVDPKNMIFEENETNNEAVYTFTVIARYGRQRSSPEFRTDILALVIVLSAVLIASLILLLRRMAVKVRSPKSEIDRIEYEIRKRIYEEIRREGVKKGPPP